MAEPELRRKSLPMFGRPQFKRRKVLGQIKEVSKSTHDSNAEPDVRRKSLPILAQPVPVRRKSLLLDAVSLLQKETLRNRMGNQGSGHRHWKALQHIVCLKSRFPSKPEKPGNETAPVDETTPVAPLVTLEIPKILDITRELEKTINILSKSPGTRTRSEIDILYNWITAQKNMKLFADMSTVTAKGLCQQMGYIKAKPLDIIIHQGERGDFCCILLSGKLSVHARTAQEQDAFETKYIKFPSTLPTSMLGTKVAYLQGREVFGELALLRKKNTRTATIMAGEGMAHIISINKDCYNRLLRNQQSEVNALDIHVITYLTLNFK